jgi:hypothetical protein
VLDKFTNVEEILSEAFEPCLTERLIDTFQSSQNHLNSLNSLHTELSKRANDLAEELGDTRRDFEAKKLNTDYFTTKTRRVIEAHDVKFREWTISDIMDTAVPPLACRSFDSHMNILEFVLTLSSRASSLLSVIANNSDDHQRSMVNQFYSLYDALDALSGAFFIKPHATSMAYTSPKVPTSPRPKAAASPRVFVRRRSKRKSTGTRFDLESIV